MRLARLGKKRAPFSTEWKEKLSKSLIGNQRTKGHKLSEEHKQKISDAVAGANHPLWGKKFTEESKKKMSISHKGVPAWNKNKKYTQIAKDKHWNWKGGVTEINHAIRTSLEYKQWRKAVYERDNYTCVHCGDNKGGNLHADHIKPFAYHPELRFEIDNGRTLCSDCHRKTDTWGFRVNKYPLNMDTSRIIEKI